MESLLNAGLGIGVLMFLVLLFKKDKQREDLLFLAWIAISLLNIVFYIITIYHHELRGIWAILSFGLPLLSVPILFLYIKSLTGHVLSYQSVIAHLSIYPLYVIILLILQSRDGIEIIASNGFFDFSDHNTAWTIQYPIPLAISGLVYCVWDLIVLAKHRSHIKEIFSSIERIKLSWLNYVVYSYMLIYLAGSILILGSIHFQLMPLEDAFALMGIALSTMLFGFGFYGFRQTPIFSNLEPQQVHTPSESPIKTKAPYSKSGLTEEKMITMADQLSKYMKEHKPYMNEDLNLKLLAEQSQIKPSYLSQIINQHFNMNFYDFINKYRVEAVKRRLGTSDTNHLTILGIAYECGFKSKSSFNRYFKKYTGMSPSSYKQQVSQ